MRRYQHEAGNVAETQAAAAIGVHWFVGYTDLWHLAPGLAAAASMIVGLTLTFPPVTPARGPT